MTDVLRASHAVDRALKCGWGQGRTHLLVDLVSKHAELKALQLHHQDSWRLVNGHALGCSHFLLLLRAYVLVGPIQILTGSEPLERLLHSAGFVNF